MATKREINSLYNIIDTKLTYDNSMIYLNDVPYGATGGVPVGTIIASTNNSTPLGYLYCDGSAVSRVDYSALFAILSTTYGIGDGTTTFNLPDLRGEFIRGADDGRGIDSGRAINTYQSEMVGPHNHTATSTFKHNVTAFGGLYKELTGGVQSGGTWETWPVDVANSTGPETRPRNLALKYYIKYSTDIVAINYSDVDWKYQTGINITATTTSPTKGAVVEDSIRYLDINNYVTCRYQFKHTTAGTNGSGAYLLQLPAGMTFDNSRTKYTDGITQVNFAEFSIGNGTLSNNSSTSNVRAMPYDANRFMVLIEKANYASWSYWSNSTYGLVSNIGFSLEFSFFKSA